MVSAGFPEERKCQGSAKSLQLVRTNPPTEKMQLTRKTNGRHSPQSRSMQNSGESSDLKVTKSTNTKRVRFTKLRRSRDGCSGPSHLAHKPRVANFSRAGDRGQTKLCCLVREDSYVSVYFTIFCPFNFYLMQNSEIREIRLKFKECKRYQNFTLYKDHCDIEKKLVTHSIQNVAIERKCLVNKMSRARFLDRMTHLALLHFRKQSQMSTLDSGNIFTQFITCWNTNKTEQKLHSETFDALYLDKRSSRSTLNLKEGSSVPFKVPKNQVQAPQTSLRPTKFYTSWSFVF